ncbi:class I poly(R)-hydroxyalkanoic acid synthase [Aliiroseovarius zhejiangensis]|uniref:Class I poly(R)-hydroxyalkanoic acid synthase n=1 Tax=Aliiroseovarius zhejiangensis TaxID=1632025 RepID=A0ABQ3IKN1_9RHOB|nr:class I poly(R)-hydroxyalkanoic acid synthase [Aliiroseovarius zhejiangensis]GHE87243.1 class I poly(R)-hydroxyalkanoic acid synthase [Aliiroseovarius zhejiangensis]
MTTDQVNKGQELSELNNNLARIEELSKRLANIMAHRKPVRPSLQAPGHDFYAKAAGAVWADMMANPSKMFEHQIAFWSKTLEHAIEAQASLTSGDFTAPEDPGPKDRRFSNPLWDTHPYYNYVKKQYLISSQTIENALKDVEGLDPDEAKRMEFFTQQIVDMMSPTNFLATNPDALERAVETNGQSLVQGLENLVADLEANDGELLVKLVDESAFEVGGNIATTPGQVVFRNRMMELIQYEATTEKVHATPLIIFPPWINKFYILDLKEQNSLIKWIVDQGYTLFVVSWVNPDASYADVGMGDYIEDGYLAAMREVKAITKQTKVNVVGYCIAGTTLSLTLSLMKKRGDKSVNSATFFTTLTDFEDQGEVGVFLNDDFVGGIEEEVQEKGYLDSFFMSRTFSYLRPNDLIYGPAINSYMLGKTPPAFDLLYWNGDSTNLPAKMTVEYLRGLCQDNRFAKGDFELLDEHLSIKDVDVPLCAIACETDHIAAWKSSYDGIRQMGSKDKTFIVSQSGHIAGIVNPPSKKKYGHYTNDDWPAASDDWMEGATFNEGSWWGRWDQWLSKRSGKQIEARKIGDSSHKPLAPAPGTYVVSKPNT